ncbi:MAG: hypothetical protein ACR2M1_09895 [Gemmatimonadaceae bacterium]
MQSSTSLSFRRVRVRSVAVLGAAVCFVALGARSAAAQGTVTHAAGTQEFGIDAGAVIGLGSQSSVQLTLPAARARIGFFLGDASRWSFEPAAFLGYTKIKDVPSVFQYDLEAGVLYHFAPPANVYSGPRSVVAYVRPFIAVEGTHTGGTSDNEFVAGGGLGVKVPFRPDVAFRLEGNLGYGFSNNAARLGAFAGLSFFTRNGIPLP